MAKLPLRVIDVERTLHSRKGIVFAPNSSSWHIISHTWSLYIQDLSRGIGNSIKESHSDAPLSYEALFEATDLSDHKSYLELLDFLDILLVDGVKRVWFDALCINQTEKRELDREIGQMGSYYHRSLGCYVVQHGVGQGYELMGFNAVDQKLAIPRWFTRAWTLQEWTLPPSVIFILDGNKLDMSIQRFISNTWSEPTHTCKCCRYDYSIAPYPIEDCKLQDHVISPGTLRTLLTNHCTRRRHFRGIKGRRGLYFVDDLAYIFLVKLALAIESPNYEYDTMGSAEYAMFLEKVERRMRLGSVSAEMQTHLVIEDIASRFVTKEEDRVLSVLKLLGVEGQMQVRTGKTLRQQVFQLANTLIASKKEELLLRLCLVDGWGNADWHGMSWAPYLKMGPGSRQENIAKMTHRFRSFYFRSFKSSAQVRGMDEFGSLIVKSFVISGCLMPVPNRTCTSQHSNNSPYESDEENMIQQDMVLQLNSHDERLIYLDGKIDKACDVYVLLHYKHTSSAQASLVFSASALLDTLQPINKGVPIWLVQVGHAFPLNGGGKGHVHTYYLTCVKDKRGTFQKVGYIGIKPHSRIVAGHEQVTCTIGGFGDF